MALSGLAIECRRGDDGLTLAQRDGKTEVLASVKSLLEFGSWSLVPCHSVAASVGRLVAAANQLPVASAS